jgi:hypothetical protein
MAKNTSILLGEHFEKFITNEVSSGKYELHCECSNLRKKKSPYCWKP